MSLAASHKRRVLGYCEYLVIRLPFNPFPSPGATEQCSLGMLAPLQPIIVRHSLDERVGCDYLPDGPSIVVPKRNFKNGLGTDAGALNGQSRSVHG